ncbi:unnamed protein product [Parnassius mnemosyne]|uniref:Uncharacterized protein n=1 Tax=Parnassius mnemosyne TaxID=213953 RepID=A0AAV1L032_9NEOP
MTNSWKLYIRSELTSARPVAEVRKTSPITLNLMAIRREMKLQSSTDFIAYRQLNRQINKCKRRDLRNFHTARIEEAIKQNQGCKVFARVLSARKSQLSKLKTECGRIVSGIPYTLSKIEVLWAATHHRWGHTQV